jgi:hypothetical protein
MTRNGTGKWLVASALLLWGSSALPDESRGPPPAPPPEALQACQGVQDGAACTFTSGDSDVTGTCRTGPDGQASACFPARPHGPPPEAFQACQSLAEGTACTVTLHGQSMSGTCRSGPRGGERLACAPVRPPGQ